ncbi:hypothetical protein N9J84_05310 [Porticoccaceae bacterium]|nr:hypothetical protein [Porticoccaceae bacterium]
MNVSGFQAAQIRPSGTTAVSAYTASIVTEIRKIAICNTTGSAAKFSLYHDDGGSTFDQTTALHYQQLVPSNTTITIDADMEAGGITVKVGGQIGVQTDTTNAFTFTMYGRTAEMARYE